MPDDPFILKNWDEQIIEFKKNLAIIRLKSEKKNVHDIRVAIKKIRSYLKLRHELTNEDWKEDFAGIKILFQTLGKQRDYEMSLELLSKFNRQNKKSLIYFKKYLQNGLKLSRQISMAATINYSDDTIRMLNNNFHSSIFSFSNEELAWKIKAIAKESLKKVNALSESFQENSHVIRKLLKDVFYWLKIFPEDIFIDSVSIKLLDKTLTDLGKCQDYFSFLKKIKGFQKEFSMTVEGKESIDILKKKIVIAQDELLEKTRKNVLALLQNEKIQSED